jgi:uncharacterized protein (TIGR03067 family)
MPEGLWIQVKEFDMTTRCVAVVAVILLAGGFGAADDRKEATDKLQGEWMLVSMEISGKKVDDNKVKSSKLVIKGNEWTAPSGPKFTFTIDPSKSPKQLDLRSSRDGMDMTWQGIYKIEGDTLTFCRSHGAGGERPTEFKGGEGVVLMVFKRAEK